MCVTQVVLYFEHRAVFHSTVRCNCLIAIQQKYTCFISLKIAKHANEILKLYLCAYNYIHFAYPTQSNGIMNQTMHLIKFN